MTEHTPIEVTQGDRDAAYSYLLHTRSLAADDYRAIEHKKRFDAGERDGSEIVQAFARYRIESQAGLVEALETIGSVCRSTYHAAKVARAALAQAKGEA